MLLGRSCSHPVPPSGKQRFLSSLTSVLSPRHPLTVQPHSLDAFPLQMGLWPHFSTALPAAALGSARSRLIAKLSLVPMLGFIYFFRVVLF